MELDLKVKEHKGTWLCRVLVTGRGAPMSFTIKGKQSPEEAFDAALVKLKIIYTSKVVGR